MRVLQMFAGIDSIPHAPGDLLRASANTAPGFYAREF